jgi:Zn-dependent peptidase ImmA (M78 family)/DNA-binding XRE family transcriptional regulator
MANGTVGFVKERLTQAREARGLTLVALADLVGVTSAAITHYEKGENAPRPETLEKIAEKLSLPLSYFLKPDPVSKESDRLFWRSLSAATKQSRVRAERRYEWFIEITEYLAEYFDFPECHIPEFDVPRDFRKIDSMLIESLAEQTRDEWRLSRGPIPDVVRTLEANGVLIALGSMGTEHIDAFSEFSEDGHARICLGIDKEIMVRRRFDAAHELGHLILHRGVDKKTLHRAADFKMIETQAHAFANAFLLPAKSFVDELFTPSLDGFRALKGRWKVSIAAMINRSQSLNLVSEDQAKRLWMNLNRRDWRRFEPLDDLAPERPQTVAKCFSTLIEEGIKSKEQIIMDLRLAPKDIEELTALPAGFLRGAPIDESGGPQLKRQQTGNVIAFRR